MTLPRLSLLQFHDFVPVRIPSSAMQKPRMFSVEFANPAVRGFSACWRRSILHIHAHYDGEGLAFYKKFPPNSTWIYMPVEAGETISDVWVRRTKHSRHMALRVGRLRLVSSYRLQVADCFEVADEPGPGHDDRRISVANLARMAPVSVAPRWKAPISPLLQPWPSRDIPARDQRVRGHYRGPGRHANSRLVRQSNFRQVLRLLVHSGVLGECG